MKKDKDERKMSHLKLVVNNAEVRSARPAGGEQEFIPLEELIQRRDVFRPAFYRGMGRQQARGYQALERFLEKRNSPYGIDPVHGKVLVLPAGDLSAEAREYGSPQDEVLLSISEDAGGTGLCFSLEMILPYFSEDDAVMEEALLFAPVLQYGALFLEENPHDGLLDLIYRLAVPLFPPLLTARLAERMFAIFAFELKETFLALSDYPEA
ncbi:hypothetical protein GMST_40420 [Geomonas silvestris]|uniref:Uncharacterized protein n=1 Tax=Geomonas silvestris TaxID=2740184 RepID=A0A6V8MPA6_9BACT|nr:hypothetical protein [Geomonas silvestris]GFO61717.1 hypothetical protein GMST_40420 [Geomonas silvestris]